MEASVDIPVHVETLQQAAERIAIAHGIATSTLANLVTSESGWNPQAVGDHGCSLGLTQQNTCTTNVTKKEALDPGVALAIAANDIAQGTEYRYTVCNCWGFLSTRIKNLPSMKDIVPNTEAATGTVAVLWYKDKTTGVREKHVAQVQGMDEWGFTVVETNFTHCLLDVRWIAYNDPHLAGFWR